MHDHLRVRATVMGAMLILGAAACAPADDPTFAEPATDTAAPVDGAVVTDLCAARVGGGDVDATADAFARAHGPLHDLARELADHDRALAGRLHEAKQQAEAALQASPDDRRLAVELDRLLEVTRESLQRLGVTAPDSCPSPPGTDSR